MGYRDIRRSKYYPVTDLRGTCFNSLIIEQQVMRIKVKAGGI